MAQYTFPRDINEYVDTGIFIRADGSRALTGDWDIGAGRKIKAEEIRARSADGLKLFDNGGNGLFVKDGGNVGIGTVSPLVALDVAGTGQFAGLLTLQNKLALGTVTTQVFDIEIEEAKNSGLGIRLINLDTGTGAYAQINPQSNYARLYQISHGSGRTLTRFGLALGGWAEISVANGASGSANGLILGTQTAVPVVLGTNNAERIRIDGGGNIGLNQTTFGTSSVKVLAMGNGTAPTSSPADAVQLWSADRGGMAGKAGLHIRSEDGTSHVLSDYVGIGTTSPSGKLDINSDVFRLRSSKTPASAGATGNAGDICWDSGYLYVCVATNTWKRAALNAW